MQAGACTKIKGRTEHPTNGLTSNKQGSCTPKLEAPCKDWGGRGYGYVSAALR